MSVLELRLKKLERENSNLPVFLRKRIVLGDEFDGSMWVDGRRIDAISGESEEALLDRAVPRAPNERLIVRRLMRADIEA